MQTMINFVLRAFRVRNNEHIQGTEDLALVLATMVGFKSFPSLNVPCEFLAEPTLLSAWGVGFKAAATQNQMTVHTEAKRLGAEIFMDLEVDELLVVEGVAALEAGFKAFPSVNMPEAFIGDANRTDAWFRGFKAAAVQSQMGVHEDNTGNGVSVAIRLCA